MKSKKQTKSEEVFYENSIITYTCIFITVSKKDF